MQIFELSNYEYYIICKLINKIFARYLLIKKKSLNAFEKQHKNAEQLIFISIFCDNINLTIIIS